MSQGPDGQRGTGFQQDADAHCPVSASGSPSELRPFPPDNRHVTTETSLYSNATPGGFEAATAEPAKPVGWWGIKRNGP